MYYHQLSARDQSAMLYQLITPLLEKAGYKRRKAKDTGGAQITEIVRDGQTLRAAYKTGRVRWFSMLPLGEGRWKTLDDADVLIFVTVSDPPTAFQLYIFPADEVRKRLNMAQAAWIAAGHKVGGFGVWLSIDSFDKKPYDVGSGLTDEIEPEWTELFVAEAVSTAIAPIAESLVTDISDAAPTEGGTIGQLLDIARMQIAALAGVAKDKIKLDLIIGV